MKPFLSFALFVTLIVSVCTTASGKGNYRVPYRNGGSWGLSDEQGNIIVPCKYAQLQYEYPYVFVVDDVENSPITIFDYNGRFVDTCSYYIPVGDNGYCIFHRNGAAVIQDIFKDYDAVANRYNSGPFHRSVDISALRFPLDGYKLLDDKSRKPIPGVICAIVSSLNNPIINHNGKCGLYDMKADSFVIAAAYDSMVFIKPAFLLAYAGGQTTLFDFNGKQFPCHPDHNAQYVDVATLNYVIKESVKRSFKFDTVSITTDKATGKPIVTGRTKNTGYAGVKDFGYRLMSNEGKTLIPAEREWQYGGPPRSDASAYIRLRKSWDSVKYGESMFQLADLNGQILLPSVDEITYTEGDMYRVTDHVGGRSKEFAFDLAQRKVVVNDQGDTVLLDTKGFYTITKNRVHFYYTSKGRLITTVADSVSMFQKEWNLVKKIDLKLDDATYRKTGVFHTTYYAFRSTKADRFAVYDEQYNKLTSTFDDFAPFISESKFGAFKRNGKWGLLDYGFKEVLPPGYDSIFRIDDNYAVTLINGMRKKIDMKTLHAVNVSQFDEFGNSSFGNNYIAVKYIQQAGRPGYGEKPKAKTVYITNSEGEINDSLQVNDEVPYQYYFTGTGKIIKFTASDYGAPSEAMIYPALHAVPKKCPYAASPELMNGRVILLQCRNEGKLGMFSAEDFKVVVPFGKYDFMFTYPTLIPAFGNGPGLETLIIKGGTNEMHDAANASRYKDMMTGMPMQSDREMVGYYSADGHVFWKN